MAVYLHPLTLQKRLMRQPARGMDEAFEYQITFPIDVKMDDDVYEVSAVLPGVSEDALDVQVVDKTLTISGEISQSDDENTHYLLRERAVGKFKRSLQLPTALDVEKVEAKLEYGILTLRIPKAEIAKPHTIKVKAN